MNEENQKFENKRQKNLEQLKKLGIKNPTMKQYAKFLFPHVDEDSVK